MRFYKRLNTVLLVALLLVCRQVMTAQQEVLHCKEQVHTLYSVLMKALAEPTDKAGIHMKYTMDILDAVGKHTEAAFEVCVVPGQIRMVGKEIEMYADEKTLCTVLPLNREITIIPASPTAVQNMMNSVNILQDSLFSLAVPIKCVDHATADGGIETEVLLSLKGKQVPGIESLALFFDRQKSLLRKMVVFYPPGGHYKQITITYTTIDYTYQNPVMANTPVENILFSAPNVLRPVYKDFTVYDTRKQPKRKSYETNR